MHTTGRRVVTSQKKTDTLAMRWWRGIRHFLPVSHNYEKYNTGVPPPRAYFIALLLRAREGAS